MNVTYVIPILIMGITMEMIMDGSGSPTKSHFPEPV
jgi:hypothetical protein